MFEKAKSLAAAIASSMFGYVSSDAPMAPADIPPPEVFRRRGKVRHSKNPSRHYGLVPFYSEYMSSFKPSNATKTCNGRPQKHKVEPIVVKHGGLFDRKELGAANVIVRQTLEERQRTVTPKMKRLERRAARLRAQAIVDQAAEVPA